jgi:hypothetical protein
VAVEEEKRREDRSGIQEVRNPGKEEAEGRQGEEGGGWTAEISEEETKGRN